MAEYDGPAEDRAEILDAVTGAATIMQQLIILLDDAKLTALAAMAQRQGKTADEFIIGLIDSYLALEELLVKRGARPI